MRVRYRRFLGIFSAESAFEKASAFATKIGPDDLINISYAWGGAAVWYWAR